MLKNIYLCKTSTSFYIIKQISLIIAEKNPANLKRSETTVRHVCLIKIKICNFNRLFKITSEIHLEAESKQSYLSLKVI